MKRNAHEYEQVAKQRSVERVGFACPHQSPGERKVSESVWVDGFLSALRMLESGELDRRFDQISRKS